MVPPTNNSIILHCTQPLITAATGSSIKMEQASAIKIDNLYIYFSL